MPATLQAHQTQIEAYFRRLVQRFTPTVIAPEVSLNVRGGLHSGLSRQFTSNTITIGSDDADDFVLLDEHVAPGHLTITFERSVFGEVAAVKAAQEGVSIGDQAVVPGATGPYESLPLTIDLGNVQLRFESVEEGDKAKNQGRLGGYLKAAVFVGVIGLFFLPLDFIPGLSGAERFRVSMMGLDGVPAASEPQETVTRDALEARIKDSGLSDYVRIKLGIGMSLVAEGSVPPAMMPAWHEIHQWYDGAVSEAALFSRVEASSELTSLAPIAAVRLSEPQEIIFASGRRVGLGEEIKDGWTVEAMTPDGLELARQGENLTLGF